MEEGRQQAVGSGQQAGEGEERMGEAVETARGLLAEQCRVTLGAVLAGCGLPEAVAEDVRREFEGRALCVSDVAKIAHWGREVRGGTWGRVISRCAVLPRRGLRGSGSVRE